MKTKKVFLDKNGNDAFAPKPAHTPTGKGSNMKSKKDKKVIAHLKDYLSLMAEIWPEVLHGQDAVYNRAEALLNDLEGGK